MSGFRRFDLFETSIWSPRFPPPLLPSLAFDAEIEVERHLGLALDLLNPKPKPLGLSLHCLDFFSALEFSSDLVEISAFRRSQERAETELCLRNLSDRVAALELGFDRAAGSKIGDFDRKYKWTAEIKGEKADRKYKWTAEAKAGEERNFKWTTEVKGKGKNAPASKTFTFEASTAPKAGKAKVCEKGKGNGKGKEKKESGSTARLVEIEEPDRGAVVIRKVFAKRALDHSKGKRLELSPQDAAVMIQMSFRAHLVRRSQVVRCLRELAVAKAKLKEIRALFYNFSYRRRIARDAEERQKFSEKIIVLLLTVDSIEGPDYMVRAARRSMVEELESMLEVVDPQPSGKLGSMKRRKFDLPVGGPISREMAAGVAEVVQMLDEEDKASDIIPDL